MRLSHLSTRSLRRAIARETRLAESAKFRLDENDHVCAPHYERLGDLLAKHESRLHQLNVASDSRPVAAHKWSLKPGEVISVWLESHGIGPDLATRAKRRRRLIQSLRRQSQIAQAILVRVVKRGENEANIEKATLAAGRAGLALAAALASKITRAKAEG